MDFNADSQIRQLLGDKDMKDANKVIRALIEKKPIEKRIVEKMIQKKDIKKTIQRFVDKKDLARQILDISPFYYDEYKIWWRWCVEDYYWKRVDEVDILNIVDEACESIDTINSKERNEILEALRQVSREIKPQPVKKTWIQFKDKIFDIENGDEFNATPTFFVTNPIPYRLHKEKFVETPVMDKIFAEWVGKDHVKTLYEILAYCLLPDYPINRIFCFVGSGMNGKSKFLELLRKFLGVNNCCSTELDSLLQSRFEVSRLHKKLVCQMGETNFNEMKQTSMLKKLSGGDLIGFEYKNKDPFEEVNYAKLLISTNNLPSTTDKTIGFYRRWMIIDFPNQFNEKKDILADIPEEEYEILAVKCCGLLKDLLDKREFYKEGSIEDRMKKYEAKSNFLEQFIAEYVVEEPDGYITKADFHKKFKGWCKENRHREMSENSLGRKMNELGMEHQKKYFNWMYDGKGGQVRCWIGIKWKDN